MPQRVDRSPFLTGGSAFLALGALDSCCSGTSPVVAGLSRTTPLEPTIRYTARSSRQVLLIEEFVMPAEIILTIAIAPRAVANFVACTCLCCNWHKYNLTSGFRMIEFFALYIAVGFALRKCRGSFYLLF